jgi:hypothetical protein
MGQLKTRISNKISQNFEKMGKVKISLKRIMIDNISHMLIHKFIIALKLGVTVTPILLILL